MTPLPREIIDFIVEYLPNIHKPKLLSVSPVFRASARASIFRHTSITFSLVGDNSRIALLLQTVQGDPRIIDGILWLTIRFDIPSKEDEQLENQGKETTTTNARFSTLLRLLCNAPLLKLTVNSTHRSSLRTAAPVFKLQPTELEGLLALRSLPSLMELSIGILYLSESTCSALLLTHPNHRIATLDFSAGHTSLKVDERVFDRGMTECGILLGLRTLRINNLSEFLRLAWTSLHKQVPKPSICIPDLTTLSVKNIHPNERDVLAAILASCPCLETLELRYSRSGCPTIDFSTVHRASRIPNLHVDFRPNLMRGRMVQHLLSLVSLLKNYPRTPHLQTIITSFYWQENRMAPNTLVALRDHVLPALREVLSSFPSSLSFVLRITFVEDNILGTNTFDRSRPALREVLDGYVVTDGVKFVYEFPPWRSKH